MSMMNPLVSRRRYRSAAPELVEVGAFAFLATELDDAAEGAIGGVADQSKATATMGAPLHAILPLCNSAIDPIDAPTSEAMCLLRCSDIRVASVIRIGSTHYGMPQEITTE
jgi:hypothetical protein